MSFLRAMCEWRDCGKIPGPLHLPDGTRVNVIDEGRSKTGTSRGASPNGNYAVLLDEDGSTGSYEKVTLFVEEKS